MQRFHILSIVVLCLIVQHLKAQNDFKAEFGEKFGNELKILTLELADTCVKATQLFYETMLKESSTTEDESKKYAESLNNLQDIKQGLISNDKQAIIAAIKQLKSVEFRKIADIHFQTNYIKESQKFHVTIVAMKQHTEHLVKAAITYVEDLKRIWRESFSKVPAEEKIQHAELAEINELIEHLSVEDDPKKDALKETMQAICNAFGYDDWKVLFAED